MSKQEKSLSKTLLIDTFAAISSAATTSPFIAIIDKAIFSNASGKETLVNSAKSSFKTLVFSPRSFLSNPTFLWIWFVYSGTYIVANCTESIWSHFGKSYTFPKFVTSSAANISLSLAKDRYFTRAFGKGDIRPVPMRSLICYGGRDSATILASFVLPSHLATVFVKQTGLSESAASVLAQLTTPCAIQLLSTPLHLYGMDYYNNSANTIHQRYQFIKREYTKTVLARMARILPAFGIGAVINSKIRALK